MASHTFLCIDAHTCGNPVRVVAGGGPFLKGQTMGDKRRYFLEHYDWIRTGLMYEPRGHAMMSGSLIFPPNDPKNDCGVLFIETSGCLPMCGHGTIGTVTVLIERGLVTPQEEGILRLEVPAGLVEARYERKGNKVTSVSITNVPSYLHSQELVVHCPELGELTVDVAYGGNFYAIVEPGPNYRDLDELGVSTLLRLSPKLRAIMNENYTFVHPEDERINGLSHILWTGKTLSPEAHGRNAVFYGDGAIDRSPCGTGTSARMAQRHAKGLLQVGDAFVHESIIGSQFRGRVVDTAKVGKYDAIIPEIQGWAQITGINTIFIDDEDPYAHGFQVL